MVFFMVAVGSMMMVVSILEKRRLAAGEMGQRSCRVSFSFLGFFFLFSFVYLVFWPTLVPCFPVLDVRSLFFSFFLSLLKLIIFCFLFFQLAWFFFAYFPFFLYVLLFFLLIFFFLFFFCLSIFFIIFLKASNEILRIMKWSKVLKTINQNGTEIHFLEFLYFFEKTFEENKGKKQFMTLINN